MVIQDPKSSCYGPASLTRYWNASAASLCGEVPRTGSFFAFGRTVKRHRIPAGEISIEKVSCAS